MRLPAGVATGLLALADASAALVERLCIEHGVAVAIRFAPDRVVVGGPSNALEGAAAEAVRAGATATPLGISIASHTPWMTGAVKPFEEMLATCPFQRPTTLLITDYSADAPSAPDALRQALAQQLAAPIDWDRCMQSVAERGATCVLEMGPGTTLSRLWNARYPSLPARSIDEFSGPAAIATWVARALS